ncbi:hypothetical protein LSCM1_03712 [Leishmania martiniquensis]|uniref:Adenosine kinase n=1 Tax=Leishmania martiniquensis TaxID=1580590 RepID=A0A836KNI8_9TRYP|nr:hypothetical protein LSCM1_03712 [Leishmania martiniquensis]
MPSEQAIPLYVQCNPLLDIVVDVDDDFLKQYHLEKDCAYIYGPQYRALFETILAYETLSIAPGGSGLKTARVAQWAWRKVLQRPGHAMYVGCVGKDQNGDRIRATAEAEGVVMQLEVSDDKCSGLCAVCRNGDARTLIAHPSSANFLSDNFVNSPAVQEGLRSATLVYTTAYASVSRVQQTLRLMTGSRTRTLPNGTKQLTAMGLSNKHVLEDFGEDLVDVLGRVDIVIGNQEEMTDLAMMLQWVPSEMSDLELVKKIATEMMYDQHAVRRVIMTRGAAPILYATSDGETGEVPAVAIRAGYTKLVATGAGDAFAGAFLAAFAAKPDDMAFCCRLGAQAATFVIDHGIKTLPTDEASLANLRA